MPSPGTCLCLHSLAKVSPSTVYRSNSVVQGFTTTDLGAVNHLGITLHNGGQVEAPSGGLQVNDFQQAEVGAPVSAGLTLPVWTAGASPLPATVDPSITGTAILVGPLATFVSGLFLGSSHALANTVNPVCTLTEVAAPLPDPAAWALGLAGGLLLGQCNRHRDNHHRTEETP